MALLIELHIVPCQVCRNWYKFLFFLNDFLHNLHKKESIIINLAQNVQNFS